MMSTSKSNKSQQNLETSGGDQKRNARLDDRNQTSPEDDWKPDSPTDITKSSWKYVAGKTMREFTRDHCTDLAASLTYYAVLALFPAAIALLSLVGLFGKSSNVVDTLLGILSDVGASSAVGTLKPTLEKLAETPGAGIALIVGLLGALWSASRYVNAFSRAMNQIYEIDEGRPIWKLRPMMIVITIILVVLAAAVLLALVVSGPLVQAIGNTMGLGSAALLAWRIAKWPVLLIIVIIMVALLYRLTPNVKQPKFRWVSIGAVVAIVVWILISIGFGFYVSNFSNYNKTYGSLAGIIVFLLWLWLTNIALLVGAELDTELERGRELQAGLPAEESIQLPARDTRNIDKAAAKHDKDVARGKKLRETRGDGSDPD